MDELELQAENRTKFLNDMREEFPETFQFIEADEENFKKLLFDFQNNINDFQGFINWLKFHVHFSKYFNNEPSEQQLGGFYNQICSLFQHPDLLQAFREQYLMRENDYAFYLAMHDESSIERYRTPVPDFTVLYKSKKKKNH